MLDWRDVEKMTQKGLNELRSSLLAVLKPTYIAATTGADDMGGTFDAWVEAVLSEVHESDLSFEVRGRYTASGKPYLIIFTHDDFKWEHHRENDY